MRPWSSLTSTIFAVVLLSRSCTVGAYRIRDFPPTIGSIEDLQVDHKESRSETSDQEIYAGHDDSLSSVETSEIQHAMIDRLVRRHDVLATLPQSVASRMMSSGRVFNLEYGFKPSCAAALAHGDSQLSNADSSATCSMQSEAFKTFKYQAIAVVFSLGLGNNVLEWGSGCGTEIATIAKQKGFSAYGVDGDYSKVAWAAQSYSNASFCMSNATAMPFNDNSFDAVISDGGFENVLGKNPEMPELRELARVLRPGACAWLGGLGIDGSQARATDWKDAQLENVTLATVYEVNLFGALNMEYDRGLTYALIMCKAAFPGDVAPTAVPEFSTRFTVHLFVLCAIAATVCICDQRVHKHVLEDSVAMARRA